MKLKPTIKNIFIALILVSILAISALADGTGIDQKLLDEIRNSLKMDSHTKAAYNAVANNDIRSLALNHQIMMNHNETFSKKIETKGITNQKRSARCWAFAALNTFRPAIIKKYNLEEFEFSQNYLIFWDKLEKANTFLERMIEFRDRDLRDREVDFCLTCPFPIMEGGYWENFCDLVNKYGLVPKKIMPETKSSGDSGIMNKIINRKLRIDAMKLRKMYENKKSVQQMRKTKETMLKETYRMLAMNLGEPPIKFQWRYEDSNSVISDLKTYTPKSFANEFVGINTNDYVNIFNDTTHDYGKHYQIKLSRNFIDGHDINYANVDIETLKQIVTKSILDDTPVLFGAEDGYDHDKDLGIMAIGLWDFNSVYNIDLTMTKPQQALYRDSLRNHAMVFIGVDVKNEKPVKWLVENSLGEERGNKGLITMYDEWFDRYVYNVIVNKKYVPEEVMKIYEKPAVILPAWDPML